MTMTNRDFQAWINSRESQILKEYKSANQFDVRHKCFISYHHADQAEAEKFVADFETVFIPRVLGVSDTDDFINSPNSDYVMDKIREDYLTDSTVTIVLIGKCTWSRKYVDWEINSTLRNNKNDKLSGLLAINLPSTSNLTGVKLPTRLADNVFKPDSYAKWYSYPQSTLELSNIIEEAFNAHNNKAKIDLINNTRTKKLANESCS